MKIYAGGQGGDGQERRETRSPLPLGGRRRRRLGCLLCCFDGGKDGEGKGEELGQCAARALRTTSLWVRDHGVELPEMVVQAGRRRRKPH
uniref:Uncharacterized protein n=1 Tax=Oryza rufipogon TaxID=4529 RepID=A0A0E0N0K0_ORYRU